jgi:hypothetical protein
MPLKRQSQRKFIREVTMGEKLLAIFDLVTQKAGTNARMQLAERTGVSRIKAAEMEDTDTILKQFKAEASQLIGQEVDELL